MNFQDPRCSLVEPRYLEFIPTGCHSSVSDCNLKASLRVVFKIGLPSIIKKSTLLVEILNLVTGKKQNYFISIPEGKCNCEPECFVSEIIREDFLYITVIFNNLIEGDNHLLQSCIDYILATPTPTVTPSISVTPTITPTISITPSITPTISVTPTITPTISVTPTITPTISVTPTTTPTVTPTITVTPTMTPSASSAVSAPYANYGGTANWNGTTQGNLTTVGSNGPASYYGTYDQHGNVSEITHFNTNGSTFVTIGNDYASTSLDKNTSSVNINYNPGPRCGARLVSTVSRDNFVYVGNANNAADGNTLGSVSYAYYISPNTITCGQFAKFLNSVFKSTTTYAKLFSGTNINGITRYGTGSVSNPYVWAVQPNMYNKPVTNVFLGDILRYCNWILDGSPNNSYYETDVYNSGDAYSINVVDPDLTIYGIIRSPSATLYIAATNEWYKAAFYDPTLFSNTGGYWSYATRSDTIPTTVSADANGNGPFVSLIQPEQEDLIENAANFLSRASWDGNTGNVTTVGTNGRLSEYGISDMNGNAWEWTDTRSGGSYFYIMGGGWATSVTSDMSRDATTSSDFTNPAHTFGIRLGTLQTNPSYNYDFMLIDDISETVPYNGGGSSDYRGVVEYNYYLSKYHITNIQYIEFLNAVASISDAYGLFGSQLQTSTRSGISRTGSAGNYTYTCKTYYDNKPVIGISCGTAMRFCNWLHNGKPSGEQNNSTTETGAYTMSIISGANPPSISRNPGALYFIPSRDEWFKAAYYKRLGDGTYHSYATKSEAVPRAIYAIDTLNSLRGNGLSY